MFVEARKKSQVGPVDNAKYDFDAFGRQHASHNVSAKELRHGSSSQSEVMQITRSARRELGQLTLIKARVRRLRAGETTFSQLPVRPHAQRLDLAPLMPQRHRSQLRDQGGDPPATGRGGGGII
jgi:hypothetical protein